MNNFRVYIKSIESDPWGEPVLSTDYLDHAIHTAYKWFSDEGWYSKIDNEEDETIFVDYHFVDNWELMY